MIQNWFQAKIREIISTQYSSMPAVLSEKSKFEASFFSSLALGSVGLVTSAVALMVEGVVARVLLSVFTVLIALVITILQVTIGMVN